MANLAPVQALPIDRLSNGWQITPGYGSPDGTVGGPKPVLLIAPEHTLETAAGAYGGFRPGFAGTIRAVLYRIKEDGVGAVADVTFQPRIGGTDVTGGELQLLVAAAVSGRWLLGAIVTAANTFDANDEIDVNKTIATVFTDGEVEVALLVEPR